MHDTFTVTRLSYDESSDTIKARAYLSRTNIGDSYASEDETVVVVEIEHAFVSSASIRLVSREYIECYADFLPTVLTAFCKAWQQKHDETNAGDSPALTTLETFSVTYT